MSIVYPITIEELNRSSQYVYNVKRAGAKGDGVTDDTLAIQAAIDHIASLKNRGIVYLPPGKYITTSTLTINSDYITIIGGGSPSLYRGDDSSDVSRGSVIRYSGTGTAIKIGIAPSINGTFIKGTRIENLRIEVDDDTSVGMNVWHSSHGRFENITIFGMKGSSNIGLLVQAGIDNIYEHIEIAGIGQTIEVTPTNYAVCLKADLGYNNEQATTTIFRRCYFHYGSHGALLNYRYDFEDCIFEACDRGVEAIANFVSNFSRCWFESNYTWDIYFDESEAILKDCTINSYSRQTFFAPGTGIKHLSINNCRLTTTNSSPILFSTANNITATSGIVTISENLLPSGIIMGGASYARGGYDAVVNTDMQINIYRFVKTSVAASTTLNPMTTEGGSTSYRMPTKGHVVGLNVYGSLPLVSGVWDIAIKNNGAAISDFSYPTIGFQNGVSGVNFKKSYYTNFINEGDNLTVYFHTGTGISPTMDYTVEVAIATGPDGRIL